MHNDFDRSRRLITADEFSSVFRLRPVFRTDHFVLYARPNTLSYARLGLVVAKRFAPRAVTRNAIKRALREGFRQSDVLKSVGVDCVVRLAKPVISSDNSATNAALRRKLYIEVQTVFAKPRWFDKLATPAAKP